jgi:hypothetical protein
MLGSLALGPRLRSRRLLATRPANRTDPFPVLGYPPTPDRSYMSNEQFTWLTPHSQREQVGLPWHTDDTTTRKDCLVFFVASWLRVGRRPEEQTVAVPELRERDGVEIQRPAAGAGEHDRTACVE